LPLLTILYVAPQPIKWPTDPGSRETADLWQGPPAPSRGVQWVPTRARSWGESRREPVLSLILISWEASNALGRMPVLPNGARAFRAAVG
jgi:hypothetical protein